MLPRSPRSAPAALSQKAKSQHTSQLAQAEAVVQPNDADLLTLDIQMRMVAQLEDAYWRVHFSKEAYYAAGRGYDQYRPAYELGWSAALERPDADYKDVAVQLEKQWEAHRQTSLLPWREVQDAVKEAWLHAGKKMQSMQVAQQQLPASAYGREIVQSIHSVYRACVLLADDVRRMSRVPMDAFSQQVLGRHIRMLRKFALQLKAVLTADTVPANLWSPLHQRLRLHWQRLKSRLSEWEAAQVFEVCELRERSLLALYQAALRKSLPAHIAQLMEQQAKLLQNNMEKLNWVRNNWTL